MTRTPAEWIEELHRRHHTSTGMAMATAEDVLQIQLDARREVVAAFNEAIREMNAIAYGPRVTGRIKGRKWLKKWRQQSIDAAWAEGITD